MECVLSSEVTGCSVVVLCSLDKKKGSIIVLEKDPVHLKHQIMSLYSIWLVLMLK